MEFFMGQAAEVTGARAKPYRDHGIAGEYAVGQASGQAEPWVGIGHGWLVQPQTWDTRAEYRGGEHGLEQHELAHSGMG